MPTPSGGEANALEATSLAKSFGTTRAVDHLTFALRRGEILGLLRPKGSGKLTKMKMILGILKLDSGSAKVYGRNVNTDPIGVKEVSGYVPETPQLYELLSGVEYLDFVGDMDGMGHAAKKERLSQFLMALERDGHEKDMII